MVRISDDRHLAHAVLKATCHVVKCLELSKERAFLEDSENEQTRTVYHINLAIIDEVYVIKVLARCNNRLIVVKTLYVETGDDFANQCFIELTRLQGNLSEIVEEELKFLYDVWQASIDQFAFQTGGQLRVELTLESHLG